MAMRETQVLEKQVGGDAVENDGVEYTSTGLVLAPDISFERWMEIGGFIGSIHRASSWFIGDWILYGERKYGEMYTQAVNDLGLDYKTCINTVYICKHVESQRRRSDLPFSHHAEVAALKPGEQRRYLKLAKDNGWTKADLRAAIKNGGELPPPAEQPDWSAESGIHAGGSEVPLPDGPRDDDADHAAAHAESEGQTIPGVARPVIGEVLLPPSSSNGFIPDSTEEVLAAIRRVAPAAIAVVKSRGKQGIKDLRLALTEAGFMQPGD